MNNNVREQGVSLSTLWKLLIKNVFSIFYFLLVGLILAVVYTQFIVQPSFSASGNIENIGAVSNQLMSTITTIAAEGQTLENVVEEMKVPTDEAAAKVAEIRGNLSVSAYNTTTLKIAVSYTGSDKEEVELIVGLVIDASIDKFIERNPTLVGKVQKQTDPIRAASAGLSSKIIYAGFVIMGAGFGALIGVAGDLINRRIFFASDLDEYNMPSNTMMLKRKKTDVEPVLESKLFKDGTLFLQDKLEGAARRSKAKVIGVTNLGQDLFNNLSGVFAENLQEVGLKTLVIDLNLETPSVHLIYNLDQKVNITNLLVNPKVEPVKVKEDLYVLPAKEYAYPARFLKDDALKALIRGYAETFDYVFVNLPKTEYYASILFNFGILDMLLVNTSFETTKMKTLDHYIANVEPEHRQKIFLNAIDSQVHKDYLAIFKKSKKVA